jgi:hypothetical protein
MRKRSHLVISRCRGSDDHFDETILAEPNLHTRSNWRVASRNPGVPEFVQRGAVFKVGEIDQNLQQSLA